MTELTYARYPYSNLMWYILLIRWKIREDLARAWNAEFSLETKSLWNMISDPGSKKKKIIQINANRKLINKFKRITLVSLSLWMTINNSSFFPSEQKMEKVISQFLSAKEFPRKLFPLNIHRMGRETSSSNMLAAKRKIIFKFPLITKSFS